VEVVERGVGCFVMKMQRMKRRAVNILEKDERRGAMSPFLYVGHLIVVTCLAGTDDLRPRLSPLLRACNL